MATKRALQRQTKTFAMKPAALPVHYASQIADLFERYLAFRMAPSDLIPYLCRAYSRIYVTTTADGGKVVGCGGINVLNINSVQMIYLGAIVVEAGFRGTGTLYQQIYRDVLCRRLVCPHQAGYLFGAIVNPYAYAALARRFDTVYPSPAQPMLGAKMLNLTITGLTNLYGTGLNFDHERGLVRPTVAMAPVAEKPLESRKGTLNFYVERNPGYHKGVGLIYAVPLTLGSFVGTWRKLWSSSR